MEIESRKKGMHIAYCILTHTHSSNNMRLDGVAYLWACVSQRQGMDTSVRTASFEHVLSIVGSLQQKNHFVIVTIFRCSPSEYKCLFCGIPTGQTKTQNTQVSKKHSDAFSLLSPHFPHRIHIWLWYSYYKILLIPCFSRIFWCSFVNRKTNHQNSIKNIKNGHSCPNTRIFFFKEEGCGTSVWMVQK